jgi:hypothetical protein
MRGFAPTVGRTRASCSLGLELHHEASEATQRNVDLNIGRVEDAIPWRRSCGLGLVNRPSACTISLAGRPSARMTVTVTFPTGASRTYTRPATGAEGTMGPDRSQMKTPQSSGSGDRCTAALSFASNSWVSWRHTLSTGNRCQLSIHGDPNGVFDKSHGPVHHRKRGAEEVSTEERGVAIEIRPLGCRKCTALLEPIAHQDGARGCAVVEKPRLVCLHHSTTSSPIANVFEVTSRMFFSLVVLPYTFSPLWQMIPSPFISPSNWLGHGARNCETPV